MPNGDTSSVVSPNSSPEVAARYERRNLPEVARYQDWELPYTLERAERSVGTAAKMDGPVEGEDWMLTVVGAADPDQILGDQYVGLRWGGRSGYVSSLPQLHAGRPG